MTDPDDILGASDPGLDDDDDLGGPRAPEVPELRKGVRGREVREVFPREAVEILMKSNPMMRKLLNTIGPTERVTQVEIASRMNEKLSVVKRACRGFISSGLAKMRGTQFCWLTDVEVFLATGEFKAIRKKRSDAGPPRGAPVVLAFAMTLEEEARLAEAMNDGKPFKESEEKVRIFRAIIQSYLDAI